MNRIDVHPSAIVDNGANIGPRTRIWHWTHICSGAVVGDDCSFGQNVFVGNDVKIGNNCKIQNNVSIFDSVILENDVFCGPSMVFTNVHNPRAKINRKNEYRKTIVKKGATIGANSTIICGIVLGENCFIAAGAVVTKNVEAYALMAGVPEKRVGWMDENGNKVKTQPII